MHPSIAHIGDRLRGMVLRRSVQLAWLLILASCGLVASTWHYFNATWDEPEHLAAGMQLLERDFYLYDVQHPPLARMAMALGPHLAGARLSDVPGPHGGEEAGRELLYRTGQEDLYLNLARAGMLPFLVILLWSTWAWTRHSFGNATALLATLFLVSTPPVLGHAGLAALDVPGAATCTLAFYCLLRWFETQRWKFALFAGVTSGLAIATKLSALPFIGLVAATWLPCWWFSRARREHTAEIASPSLGRWSAQAGSIVLLALICAIFTYSFRFHYTIPAQQPVNAAWTFLFGASGWVHDAAYAIARSVPLPTGLERLVLSIQALLQHNHDGHLSYLLRRFSETGFPDFYVVALAVKTPLPLLLLGLAGLILLGLRARQRSWTAAAPVIAFVVLLAFCSFYSRINIGLRHVFVLYPLLCMAAAACSVEVWQRYRNRLTHAALALLVCWQVSLLYSAYPDYLAYFNITAGNHPERILIDSDLDWGQDVARLRRRLMQLQVKQFSFVYRGTIDVIGERLPGVRIAQPFQPVTGWVAASIFAEDTESHGAAFSWLQRYRPIERIGKSIDLYYIPKAVKH
jgi:Dolichyl-phosphate-mannose-protein mannosyltransferase